MSAGTGNARIERLRLKGKKVSKKNQKHMLRCFPIDKTRELYPLSLAKVNTSIYSLTSLCFDQPNTVWSGSVTPPPPHPQLFIFKYKKIELFHFNFPQLPDAVVTLGHRVKLSKYYHHAKFDIYNNNKRHNGFLAYLTRTGQIVSGKGSNAHSYTCTLIHTRTRA